MMARAIGQRILAVVPVMLGVAIVSFFMIRLIPGDIVDSIMGTEYSDPVVEASLREYYGIDAPWYEQFATWFGNVITGDLGTSYFFSRPVSELLADVVLPSLELMAASMLVALLLAVVPGVYAAVRRGKATDLASRA
ncbi:MAG TPA: ABC transporter permease, partial [Agromyces sp.]